MPHGRRRESPVTNPDTDLIHGPLTRHVLEFGSENGCGFGPRTVQSEPEADAPQKRCGRRLKMRNTQMLVLTRKNRESVVVLKNEAGEPMLKITVL